MKNTINGAIYMLLAISLILNVMQFNGEIGSPKMVKLEQSDAEKLASIYGGM